MAIIVDKRFMIKTNQSNSRQKFIDRYKEAIKNRVKEIIGNNSIKNFDKGVKKVKLKRDDLAEPEYELDQTTGKKVRVLVGNKKYKKGDLIRKPDNYEKMASKSGEGEDDFEFVITEKEFRDHFFEDLELPELVKREFLGICWEIKHAGFSRYGGPSSLNIRKTMLNSIGRRLALKAKMKEKLGDNLPLEETNPYLKDLKLRKKLIERSVRTSTGVEGVKNKKIQYIEDIDLKYNFKERQDVPITRAVMFCLMDVSGSMGESEKDISKRFFILLYLFLKKNYQIVDVVFVRHTETAKEVTEEEFFHSRESGGTLISSGYEKIDEIINSKYSPAQWNIYVSQASDGDNWPNDYEYMQNILLNKLLPVCQYFAYIDITEDGSNTYKLMRKWCESHKNLEARVVNSNKEIFEVFRSLFKKRGIK